MHTSRRRALGLAGVYLAFSTLWILGSDWLLDLLTGAETFRMLSSVKGLIFVTLSAGVVYALALRLTDGVARDTHVLLQAQRQAHVGLFASSLAHDVNNTLMAVAGGVALLREDLPRDAEEHHSLLDEIDDAIGRGSQLARQLARLGATNSDDAVVERDVHRIVEEALRATRLHRAVRHCNLVALAPTGEPGVAVVRSVLLLALENAIINAGQACDGHGRIEVSIAYGPDAVVVELHDDGPGIPASLRERVMQPFFSTRDSGSGLGMLSLQSCALLHDGDVEIDDSPLGGACIRLTMRTTVAVNAKTDDDAH